MGDAPIQPYIANITINDGTGDVTRFLKVDVVAKKLSQCQPDIAGGVSCIEVEGICAIGSNCENRIRTGDIIDIGVVKGKFQSIQVKYPDDERLFPRFVMDAQLVPIITNQFNL